MTVFSVALPDEFTKSDRTRLLQIIHGITFKSLSDQDKMLWLEENSSPLLVNSPKRILDIIFFYKNEVRESSRGFIQIDKIVLSESDFSLLKKQQAVDGLAEKIYIYGIDISGQKWMPDHKIMVINKCKDDDSLVPINKIAKILEIKNDTTN